MNTCPFVETYDSYTPGQLANMTSNNLLWIQFLMQIGSLESHLLLFLMFNGSQCAEEDR